MELWEGKSGLREHLNIQRLGTQRQAGDRTLGESDSDEFPGDTSHCLAWRGLYTAGDAGKLPCSCPGRVGIRILTPCLLSLFLTRALYCFSMTRGLLSKENIIHELRAEAHGPRDSAQCLLRKHEVLSSILPSNWRKKEQGFCGSEKPGITFDCMALTLD